MILPGNGRAPVPPISMLAPPASAREPIMSSRTSSPPVPLSRDMMWREPIMSSRASSPALLSRDVMWSPASSSTSRSIRPPPIFTRSIVATSTRPLSVPPLALRPSLASSPPHAPISHVAPAALTAAPKILNPSAVSRPLSEFEFEKLTARTSATQTILANLDEDIHKLRVEYQQKKEKTRQLEEALAKSMPTEDHYLILRAMSTEHLAQSHVWENKEIDARNKERIRFEEMLLRLQASLSEKDAQLKEFDQINSQLQRASAGQREYEEKSARYTEQVQQLSSLQNLMGERQGQVEAIHNQAVDVWKQLQNKIWEVDELRAECETWKLQWHSIVGGKAAGVSSPRATSPARQLFLAHLDVHD